MPYPHKQYEQEVRSAVRDVLALNPAMGAKRIAKALSDKFNTPFDEHYVLRIMKKSRREVMTETERRKATEQVTIIAEHLRMVNDQLDKIIFSQKGEASHNARIYAASQLAFNLEKIFGMMKDAGVFKELDSKTKNTENNLTLTIPEDVAVFLANAKKWHFGRIHESAKVETPIMLDAEVVELSNGEIIDNNKPIEKKIFTAGAVDVTKPRQPVTVRADAAERLAALSAVNGPKQS